MKKGIRKKIRRTLSVSLALLLTVCMLPLNVLAEGLQDVGDAQDTEVIEGQLPGGEEDLTDGDDLDAGNTEIISGEAEEDDSEDADAEEDDSEDADTEEDDSEDADAEEKDSEESNSEETSEETSEDADTEEEPSAKKGTKGALRGPVQEESIEDYIEWIDADDIILFEGETGWRDSWYNPETEQEEDIGWEAYDTVPHGFTVKFVGDDEPTHYDNFWHFYDEFLAEKGFDFYPIGDDQEPGNIWEAGTEHDITFFVGGLTTDFQVIIQENPILSIEVGDITVYDNELEEDWGYEDEYGWHELEEPYYRYHTYPYYMKVVTTEGTFETSEEKDVNMLRDELAEALELDEFEFCDHHYQSPDNVWEIGDHEVVFRILGTETTYLVHVVQNPILNIEVGDMVVFDNEQEDCNWYFDEKGEWHELPEGQTFKRYPTYPNYLKVETTRGTFETSDGPDGKDVNTIRNEIAETFGIDKDHFDFGDQSDQRPDNLWGIGKHDATFRILGKEGAYQVDVRQNPIISIHVDNLTVLEGDYIDDGWYEDETGEGHGLPEGQSYKRYNTWPMHIVVETTIGDFESKEGDVGYVRTEMAKAFGIDENRFDFGDHHYQSPTNQWETGEHDVNFRILGVGTTYKVNVVENPVKKVEVSDVKLLEGDKETRDRYKVDDEYGGHDVFEDWEAYRTWPGYFKVWTSDTKYIEGNRIEDILDIISKDTGIDQRMMGYGVMDDTQKPDNEWGIGTYNLRFGVCGVNADYVVEIVDNPIDYVIVDPLEFVEGDMVERWWNTPDPETGEDKWEPYSAYDAWPRRITVKLNGEAPVYGNREWVCETISNKLECTINMDCRDDQTPDHVWEAGEHEVNFIFGGYKKAFNVNILNSPIISVSFPKTRYYVEGDTHKEFDYWDESGHHDFPDGWDHYGLYPDYMEVEVAEAYLDDGESNPISGDPGYVMGRIAEMLDTDPDNLRLNFNDDQSPEHQLVTGILYPYEVNFAGANAIMNVEIVPFPIQSVELGNAYSFYDELSQKDYYFDEEGIWHGVPDGFDAHEDFPSYIKVFFENGTVVMTDQEEPGNVVIMDKDGNVTDRHPGSVEDEVRSMLKDGVYVNFDVHPESHQKPGELLDIGIHPAKFYFGNQYYFYNVVVMSDMGRYTGLIKTSDTAYQFYNDGFIDNTSTGFAMGPVFETYDDRDETKCVMVPDSFGFWYYQNGVVDLSETGPLFAKGAIPNMEGEPIEGTYKLSGGRWDAGFTDFVTTTDAKYYFKEGVMQKECFVKVDGNKYYADKKGVIRCNQIITVSGNKYIANKKGIIQTNGTSNSIVTFDGNKYIVNKNGVIQTNGSSNKIYSVGSKYYIVNKNGVIQKDGKANKIYSVGSNKYIVDKNGVIQKGSSNKIVSVGNSKYIVNKNGIIQTNGKSNKIYTVGSYKYIVNKNGIIQTNGKSNKIYTVGSSKYIVNKNGVIQTNGKSDKIISVGNNKYIVNKKGVVQTGWKQIGSKWYYLTPSSGVMIVGKSKKIDGKTYTFDSKGVCKNKK